MSNLPADQFPPPRNWSCRISGATMRTIRIGEIVGKEGARRENSRPTIYDVARHAGVSQTTVTHVLNGNRPVSEQTQAIVWASVKELEYRPNEIARALRQQRTNSVALVVPNISHTLYPIIAREVGTELRHRSYQLSIYDTDYEATSDRQIIETLAARGVDGVVFFGYTLSDASAELMARHRLPFVNGGINEKLDLPWDTVISDQESGISAMVALAARRTKRSIAYAGGAPGSGPAELREHSFRASMVELKRPMHEELIVRSQYSIAGGRAAANEILRQSELPGAVVCANDLIALGVIAELIKRGIRIPDEVAVSGYDNTDFSEGTAPTLTSVESFAERQAKACVDLLFQRIEGVADGRPQHVVIPTAAVERDST